MDEEQQNKPKEVIPPVYKDHKSGHVLYGFGSWDVRKLYILMWIVIIILLFFAAMAGYILWKIEAYNIVGKYIARCVC